MAENDQHLKHGKALCGKVFGRFVETFNTLVDFKLGLKGDAQGKNGEGHISYDRKNNIIRCDGCGGKGGSGSGVTANEKSCFRIEYRSVDVENSEEKETEIHRFLVDCYYNVGGTIESIEDVDVEDLIPHQDEDAPGDEDEGDETVLYFNVRGDDVEVGACTIDELEGIQKNADNYAFALYLFDPSGNILTDLRTAPQLQMVERGLL